MRIPLVLPLIAAVAAVCAGCGGVSGGGVQVTHPGGQLGSRGVPGGTIAVSTAGAVVAGSPATFHVTCSGLAPTGVSAWIETGEPVEGAEEVPGSAATPAGAEAYDVVLAVPSPVAGHLRVRVACADGSVIETGSSDFPLAGR
jgi:hypothetical protein